MSPLLISIITMKEGTWRMNAYAVVASQLLCVSNAPITRRRLIDVGGGGVSWSPARRS